MAKENMFPAPAGMSPTGAAPALPLANVPRTRGDEPQAGAESTANAKCSPHPRG